MFLFCILFSFHFIFSHSFLIGLLSGKDWIPDEGHPRTDWDRIVWVQISTIHSD
jgi:hypothetical protein